MIRALVPLVVALSLAGIGALAGWLAEANVASALVLQAEPVLLVLAVWSIATARWFGQPGLAIGLSLGTIGFVAGLRIPGPVSEHEGVPPEWMSPVSRCAAALTMPVDPVNVLQWTLDPSVPPEAVRAVISATAADVVVLHGVSSVDQVDGLSDLVGGEARLWGAEGGATAVVAKGGFHPCGDGAEWSEEVATGDGYTVMFVGVPPTTIFPLVVTAFPAPLADMWAARTDALSGAVLDAVAGLQGASAVVVADARAPSTFRSLDLRMANVGLSSVPLPPSWPARLGPVPVLPLHPYARVWTGPVWNVQSVTPVSTFAGRFAPVLASIAGPTPPDELAPRRAPRRKLDEPVLEEAPAE